ncbi:MAG: hypothetical protein Q4E99_05055 [Bacillota bacterium]|nr:hypothetical protein [Bacillota bacterium]
MDSRLTFPENVLFVGGHIDFVKKIRKEYPTWTFLDSSEINSSKVKKEYALIIIQTNHVSHNIVERAKAFCKDIPIVYSNCTNVSRALGEAKECYFRYLSKN